MFLQEYLCRSTVQNAMQISNQFKFLKNEHKLGILFKEYQGLNENKLLSLEYKIQNAVKSKSYGDAV